MSILTIIWRLLVIGFGVLVATIAAILFLGLAVGHGLMTHIGEDPSIGLVGDVIGAMMLFLTIASESLLPWLIAVLVAEVLMRRGLVFHLIAGGLAGGSAILIRHPVLDARPLQIAVATGLVAGLVYWVIAGRNAGNWGQAASSTIIPGPTMPPPPPERP